VDLLFKINVDGNDISIKLIQHHFIEATYEELILFHDTNLETELYQLPDELTEVGALENLYRLARGTNQVEQIPVNPEWFTNTGQKISGSHYVTQIVVCQKREIYYDSDSFEYVPFDVQLIRSTQEQLYEKEVAYRNARALGMALEITHVSNSHFITRARALLVQFYLNLKKIWVEK
jgi:hypothetical protein